MMSMKSLGGSWKNGNFNLVAFHTASAKLQLHNACPEDSAFPHISHFSFTSIPRAYRQSFVGRMFLQALHSRCLILLGQFSRHTIFQIDFIPELSELLPPSPLLDSSFKTFCATLYLLFTENLPFVVHAHTIASSGSLPLMGMLSTISASCGRKRFFTFTTSHALLSVSSKLDTFSVPKCTPIGLFTLNDSEEGIHLSFHLWTLSPFLMHHLEPLSTTFLVAYMLLHTYEGLLPRSASLKLPFQTYFILNTL